MNESALIELSQKHPRTTDAPFSYGTAGFRMRAHLLPPVVFRTGLLAALRSQYHNGAAIGVMVTASHNPPPDNGVKLVDPLGEMLEQSWEAYATRLANATSEQELVQAVAAVVSAENIDLAVTPKLVVARDTRESGPALVAALVDGASVLQSVVDNRGVLSTPQLHYMVRCLNTNGVFGEPSEDGYYAKHAKAFQALVAASGAKGTRRVFLDGANGVGASKAKALAVHLTSTPLLIEVSNSGEGANEELNSGCGADYVKTNQRAPTSMASAMLACDATTACASVDGDADRLVYFYQNAQGAFRLLDGDKLATLAAVYLSERLKSAQLSLSLGVVQTAYSNGASTDYLQNVLGVSVAVAKTGVKYVHHAALAYDIGIYFEANGHGTVLFSQNALSAIESATKTDPSNQAAQDLLNMSVLINQAVGDALSDLLMTEVILLAKGWSAADWDALYTELPNRMRKVTVSDRTSVKVSATETEVLEPSDVQAAINGAVGQVASGRSFARPSGTEDVVRVYAEAATQQEADQLAIDVSCIVYDFAGGVGERPA